MSPSITHPPCPIHFVSVAATLLQSLSHCSDEVDAFLTKRGAQSEHEATLQVRGGRGEGTTLCVYVCVWGGGGGMAKVEGGGV